MQKTIYYSKKYRAIKAEDLPNASGADKPAVPQAASVAKPVTKQRSTRTAGMLIGLCLVLALTLVLVVPTLVGGAVPPATSGRAAEPAAAAFAAQNRMAYTSVADATAVLGASVAVPQVLPEGFSISACMLVNDTVLELELTRGTDKLYFRASAGADDLSGVDIEQYTFMATETVDGVVRSYAGSSQDELAVAVWANGGCTYAIVAEGEVDAESMRQIAESVV